MSLRVLWPFILEGGLFSVVLGFSVVLIFNVYLKVSPKSDVSNDILNRKKFESPYENLDEALIQPPFLPSSNPFWRELFQREWKAFSEIIMNKFIMSWYRLLSLDSDEDFTKAFLEDMKSVGEVVFEMLANLESFHEREWSLWLINEVIGTTALNHFSRWKQLNSSYDVFGKDIFSPNLHEETSTYSSLESNEISTILLDIFVQKMFQNYDKISVTSTLGSKSDSYTFFRKNQLARHFLLVILRDLLLVKSIKTFHIGKYIENYLKNRNPLVNLSSLDLEDDDLRHEKTIFPGENLFLPILKLVRQHTETKWQQTICLLILGVMRVPVLGKWLKNWANGHVHRFSRRLIHPWMLCKWMHHLSNQMTQDQSVKLSPVSFEYQPNFVEQHLAKLAKCIVLHEPVMTDEPYLVLKVIDDICNSISS